MKRRGLQRFVSFVICLMLAINTATIFPTGLFAQNTFDPQAQYWIVNKATGKVLERTLDTSYVPGRSDVFKIVVNSKNDNNANQKWRLESYSYVYRLINIGDSATGLHKTNESYPGITGANHVVGVANLSIATPQQHFYITDASNGYVTIMNNYNEGSGQYNKAQYLAATNNAYELENGAFYIACTAESNSDAQLWSIEKVPGTGTQPLDPLEPFEPKAPLIQDSLEKLAPGSISLTGYVNDSIVHVQNDELKKLDWIKLVDQFRYKTDTDNRWRGEFWGKYMRGACFIYAYTQDKELYDLLKSSVLDILSTQDKLTGRISSYPNDWGTWDIWSRKYVMLGLESFYEICDDEELKNDILTALCYHADYIINRLGPASEGKIHIVNTGFWSGIASCSILEPMVKLYNLTGFDRYLDFSSYIVSTGCTNAGVNIFELAYEGKVIPSKYFYNQAKAYEMTSCFEGLAEFYRVTGIEKWRTACINYYKLASENEITVAGSGSGVGHGYGYTYFNPNGDEQWNNMRINQTDQSLQLMQETCVTVTWMKYCYQMLRLTGDSKIADDIELTIYNALLGAIKPEGVENDYEFVFSYFSSLAGTRPIKGGGAIFDQFGPIGSCCSANGSSGIGIIPFFATMNSQNGPVINLYNAGTVKTKTPGGNGLELTFETEYPKTDSVRITVGMQSDEQFSIKLRIPNWSTDTVLKVNGVTKQGVSAGSYYEIEQAWKNGDVIELSLDMSARIMPAPNGSDMAAILRGPIALARDSRFNDGSLDKAVYIKPDSNGFAQLTAIEADFPAHMAFEVKTGSGVFYVTDYASAGGTWSNASRYKVWLNTTDDSYILEENVKYYITCAYDGRIVKLDKGTNSLIRANKPADASMPEGMVWLLEKVGNFYKIVNPDGLCITLNPSQINANGAKYSLQTYAGSDNQLWSLVLVQSGFYKLFNKASGRLLSEAGDSENIHQWEDVQNPMQMWKFEKCEIDEDIAKITDVYLPVDTVVSGYAANISAIIKGENLSGKQVRLSIISRNQQSLGEIIYESGLFDASDEFTIDLALDKNTLTVPAGEYAVLVQIVDSKAKAEAALTIESSENIWDITVAKSTFEDQDALEIKFLSNTLIQFTGYVAINGIKMTNVIYDGGSIFVLDDAAINIGNGSKVTISGIKYPNLFPSYKFTFTKLYVAQ